MRFFRFVIILLSGFYTIIYIITSYFSVNLFVLTPGCWETSGGRRRTDLTGIAPISLSDLIACDAFNARTMTDREYLIICTGRRLVGSRPTVRGFAQQLSAQNLYLMFDVQLPRNSEGLFCPSLYPQEKQPLKQEKLEF